MRCLAYITSGWQRLTVVTLIVMLICGLGTLAFLKLLSPSKPSRAATPGNVAERSAHALPPFTAQNNPHDPRSTTRVEEIPSKPAINDTSGERPADSSNEGDVGSGPEVARIEDPRNNSGVVEKSLGKPAEGITGARHKLRDFHAGRAGSPARGPRPSISAGVANERLGWSAIPRRVPETATPKRETQAVLHPAPFKSSGVPVKRMPSRRATDAADATNKAVEDRREKTPPQAPPAPLTIEVQRPRSVAARNESSRPAAAPGRNTKTKVIQWP